MIEKILKKCRYFNGGYCRLKSSCKFLHPKDHCKIDKCIDKACPNRHIKPSNNWLKNACKFDETCEFKHEAVVVQRDVTGETVENQIDTVNPDDDIALKDTPYYYYDNLDFDSDDDDDTNENLVEQKQVPHTTIDYSCDKCDYKTKSKIHLIVHEKSCHKIIEINKEEKTVTKKRKTNDDNLSSRKKA